MLKNVTTFSDSNQITPYKLISQNIQIFQNSQTSNFQSPITLENRPPLRLVFETSFS